MPAAHPAPEGLTTCQAYILAPTGLWAVRGVPVYVFEGRGAAGGELDVESCGDGRCGWGGEFGCDFE